MNQSSPSIPLIFDKKSLMLGRKRANLERHGYLFEESAKDLFERLSFIKRPFPCALDLGSRGQWLANFLQEDTGRNVIRNIAMDEEYLPFAKESFDLIVSNLALHWVNDLPGALAQVRGCLKPDGLFLAAVFGGDTLCELKACLFDAEMDLRGGISPRISPFLDVREAGALLQRAGFALPVVAREKITFVYKDAFALMHELRGMGETNHLINRSKRFAPRELFTKAADIYQQRFALEGGIAATFEIIIISGWAPHESQQKPLKPGEAKHSLADALNARGGGMDGSV